MKAHAVPQEIMSVEFKLFGNFLSLREFIYISVGVAISYFIYFLMNRGVLPGILAWPMILVIGGGGTIISLVPFQGRSLETWIMNYFTAIQRPTQRVWQKIGFDPLQTASGANIIRKDHVVSPPVNSSSQQVAATGTTAMTDDEIPIEQEESKRLREISTTIQNVEDGNPATASPSTSQVQPPKQASSAPPVKPAPVQPQQPAQSVTAAKPAPPEQPTPPAQPTPTAKPAPPAQPPQQNQSTTLTITDTNYNDFATEIPGVQPQKDTINIVVTDQADQFIPQVTCIIKDAGENPVRASVSNQLGQIINNVPLKKGTYKIQLSKQGLIFPVITRVLSGKIYPPLKIKSL